MDRSSQSINGCVVSFFWSDGVVAGVRGDVQCLVRSAFGSVFPQMFV